MADLRGLRDEIDQIDAQLLRLLEHRLEIAGRMGAVKRAAGRAGRDPSREAEILARLEGQTTLRPELIRALWGRLFSESLARQGR